MKKVLIICVNYNNDIETIEYVKRVNLLSQSQLCDIVIVDNSGKDSQYKKLKSELFQLKNVYLVNAKKNLGYFGGMDYGLKYYISITNKYPDWIIVSNTDIDFADNNFLIDLSNRKEEDDIGVLAPKILTLDNVNQNPYMISPPNSIKINFLLTIYQSDILYKVYLNLSRFKNRIKSHKSSVHHPSEYIFAPHGSFIIISKSFFEHGGDLNYTGFLYGEEIYLGLILKEFDFKVRYCDDLTVYHHEHATTAKLSSVVSRKHRYNSVKTLKKMLKRELWIESGGNK